ncbi:helix-turn-helix domain-containing protein [Bradyrhizobium prioriisuperbiae]|uniref:MerR family transcriptional regulator n=1 Tax=Bradyrhizobium prioriisuperbiae TaxID=2854389 RepID=UPI0028E9E888|nr:helix-turn-helix domain-containing protein [Bradyrhizobium prioritasuperba]
MTDKLSIGEAARQSGIKIPTIRYYEQIGLLPAPPRTDGNRRCYGKDDIGRLGFIRHARELGFEIEAIRAMLDLQDQPDRSCQRIDALTRAHLVEIEARIVRLNAMRQELQRMLACCAGGRVAECRIIEAIATV